MAMRRRLLARPLAVNARRAQPARCEKCPRHAAAVEIPHALWHLTRMANFHDFTAKTIDGTDKALKDYAGTVLLVVNVASQCGLTPQYEGLQKLHEQYRGRGAEVLGFPCNQFAGQEPGNEPQIKTFCETHYGVTFPLFAKLEVNGTGRHPLYTFLTAQATQPDGPGDIQWNFAKFVVDKRGTVVARFSPTVTPSAPELTQAIDRALA
jgi:glutathione peroxidase